MKRQDISMREFVGTDSDTRTEHRVYHLIQRGRSDCGLVAVRAVLLLAGNAHGPTTAELRAMLRKIGYPKRRTGTSAAHLGWLLTQYNRDALVFLTRRNLGEIWAAETLIPTSRGTVIGGRIRRGAWAHSATLACAELASSQRLCLAEATLLPLLQCHERVALIVRVQSAEYFSEPADSSAHFIALLPSSSGYLVIDGYGAESSGRALRFNWLRWSDDLVLSPLRRSGLTVKLRKQLKAESIYSVVGRSNDRKNMSRLISAH